MRQALIAIWVWLSVVPDAAFGGGDVSVDANAGRGIVSALSTAELEVGPTLNFNVGYGFTQLASVPPEEASGLPAFRPSPIHQLLAGGDWALSSHWLLSGLAQVDLPSSNLIPIAPSGLGSTWSLETSRQSQGGLLILSFDRGGWSDFEPGGELSLSVAHYQFGTAFNTRSQDFSRSDPLWIFRPSVSFRASVRLDTELSFRITPTLYSSDPLAAGRLSDAQLDRIDGLASRRFGASLQRVAARLERIDARLTQADATSGLTSAPLRLELRPQFSHRFFRWLRGQLAYGYLLYVPGQGRAHVLSTRWTFSLGKRLRLWGTAALQLETPPGGPTTPFGLLGLGTELSF